MKISEQPSMFPRLKRPLLATLALLVLLALGLGIAYLLVPWGLASSPQQASYEQVNTWQAVKDQPFNQPFAIAADPRSGRILLTDAGNQRVVVFARSGRLVHQFGAKGDGPGKFQRPTGVAVGPDGAIYVADYMQDRIQKFTPEGEFLLQWGDPGNGHTQFSSPNGLAVDNDGRVYVADFMSKRIKVFTGQGEFVATVGRPGQWRLGALDYPTDVAVGPAGWIVVADAYNYRVQRYTEAREPQAAWGWHVLWAWPRPAEGATGLNIPTGVSVGPKGLIHVADSANNRVVMLDAQGRYVTDWQVPDPGNGYHTPNMVAAGPDGRRVYVTDIANNRVLVLKLDRSE